MRGRRRLRPFVAISPAFMSQSRSTWITFASSSIYDFAFFTPLRTFSIAGWYFERVRAHPLVRAYRDKCFLFCANPFVIPLLPGVYAGVERRWSSSRSRGRWLAWMLQRARREGAAPEAGRCATLRLSTWPRRSRGSR